MNRIIAFLGVLLFWLLMPVIVVVLSIGVAISIVIAGSQVMYQYFLNELSARKNR